MSLGIDAPPQAALPRDEVQARVQEQNRLAAEASAIPLDAFSLLKRPPKVATSERARTIS